MECQDHQAATDGMLRENLDLEVTAGKLDPKVTAEKLGPKVTAEKLVPKVLVQAPIGSNVFGSGVMIKTMV